MNQQLEANDEQASEPFECLYCGTACELSDSEPYCSPECAYMAEAESEEDR